MTAPCTVTWWDNLRTPEGTEQTLDSWRTLFQRFAKAPRFAGQDAHPGWSPARFEPCRRAADNVRELFALCLDYDGGERMVGVERAWDGTYGLLHTTRRHSAEAPRFRLVLPLSRPVSPFEFRALWDRVTRARGSDALDQAPKDPSRFWYLPGTDGEYVCRELDGEPLNVDRWLAWEPETRVPREAPGTDVERRAVAYIAKMPPAISGQGGHQSTWQVALVLARGFGFDEEKTFRILRDHYNDRCDPPWREKELRHKAYDAANADRVEHGFLLKDDRGWRDRSFTLPPPPEDHAPDPEPPEDLDDTQPEPEPEQRDARPAIERYGLRSMQSLMVDVLEELRKPRKKGLKTGSEDLDWAIGGYRPGNVTVFGAKRGFGKTSYGNLVAQLAMDAGAQVAMFAGEDSAAMYGKRFLAARAGINAMMLRDNRVNREDWRSVVQACESASTNPFFTRVEGRPVEWIAQAIRDIAAEQQLDLVIVDYLQCIGAKKRTQDRRTEVTYITQVLSNAIKSAGSAGILFSQLKRGERTEPDVEDLKESGDIEDSADHILLGWKIESKKGEMDARRMIRVGKNKDGMEASEVAPVEMRWNRKTAAFEVTPSNPWGGQTYDCAPDPPAPSDPRDFEDDDEMPQPGLWGKEAAQQ